MEHRPAIQRTLGDGSHRYHSLGVAGRPRGVRLAAWIGRHGCDCVHAGPFTMKLGRAALSTSDCSEAQTRAMFQQVYAGGLNQDQTKTVLDHARCSLIGCRSSRSPQCPAAVSFVGRTKQVESNRHYAAFTAAAARTRGLDLYAAAR